MLWIIVFLRLSHNLISVWRRIRYDNSNGIQYNEFRISATAHWKKVIMPSNLSTRYYRVNNYKFVWPCNFFLSIHSRNMQFKLFDVKVNIDMRNTNMDTPSLEKSMLGHLCWCFKLYLAINKKFFCRKKFENIISYDSHQTFI